MLRYKETEDIDARFSEVDRVVQAWRTRSASINQAMRWLERNLYLQIVDQQWKDHLLAIDHLRSGIGLAGYAQKDPLVEFKRRGFDLFEEMMNRIEEETLRILFNIQIQLPPGASAPTAMMSAADDGELETVESGNLSPGNAAAQQARPGGRGPATVEEALEERLMKRRKRAASMGARATFTAANRGAAAAGEEDGPKTVRRSEPKVRRNEMCPCGSGKKYKKCCGK